VYVVADDAWHETMISAGQVYGPLRAVLAEGVAAVGGRRTAAGERLALSADFLDFLTTELEEVARRWEKRRAAQLAEQPAG
jgi:hypothetical protein